MTSDTGHPTPIEPRAATWLIRFLAAAIPPGFQVVAFILTSKMSAGGHVSSATGLRPLIRDLGCRSCWSIGDAAYVWLPHLSNRALTAFYGRLHPCGPSSPDGWCVVAWAISVCPVFSGITGHDTHRHRSCRQREGADRQGMRGCRRTRVWTWLRPRR